MNDASYRTVIEEVLGLSAGKEALIVDTRFGIPQGGRRTPDGKLCKNNQLEPCIRVKNDPDVMSAGRDQQIEAAVRELLKKK